MNREQEATFAAEQLLAGSKVKRVWALGGGMSAEMLGLEFDCGRKLVARFPGPGVCAVLADPADYEAKALRLAKQNGLPVAEPNIAQAKDGKFLLLDYLPGQATAAPLDSESFVRQMAETLAFIHKIPVTPEFDFLLHNKPGFTPPGHELIGELREPEVVEALLKSVPKIADEHVFRHGDFWPGNVLWADGKISGIVDWENAILGPALADLSISRLDIYWVLGRDAMLAFTEHYLKINPLDLTNQRYWDLRAAHRPMSNFAEWAAPYASLGRPDITYASMRDVLLDFVSESLAQP